MFGIVVVHEHGIRPLLHPWQRMTTQFEEPTRGRGICGYDGRRAKIVDGGKML